MRGASGADTAIINGGTIRTSIKQGPIKVSNVYAVVPLIITLLPSKLTRQTDS